MCHFVCSDPQTQTAHCWVFAQAKDLSPVLEVVRAIDEMLILTVGIIAVWSRQFPGNMYIKPLTWSKMYSQSVCHSSSMDPLKGMSDLFAVDLLQVGGPAVWGTYSLSRWWMSHPCIGRVLVRHCTVKQGMRTSMHLTVLQLSMS